MSFCIILIQVSICIYWFNLVRIKTSQTVPLAHSLSLRDYFFSSPPSLVETSEQGHTYDEISLPRAFQTIPYSLRLSGIAWPIFHPEP